MGTVATEPSSEASPEEALTVADPIPSRRDSMGFRDSMRHLDGIALRECSEQSDRQSRKNHAFSSQDAQLDDERRRTAMLAAAGLAFDAIGFSLLPILGAAVLHRTVCAIGLAGHFLICMVLWWATRSRPRFEQGWVGVCWPVSISFLLPTVYFFGALSVASISVFLGIHVASRSRSRWIAWSTFATASVGCLVVVVLDRWGPGGAVVSARDLAPAQLTVATLLLEALLVATFVMGRRWQLDFSRSLTELERAVREVAQREALLEEARQEFRRALRVGEPSRLTGVRLGSYELGVLLGHGAMGEVYEARNVDSQMPAAVKVLSRSALRDGTVVQRFLREWQLLRRLEHPHIVRLLDASPGSDDLPFIAMEHLVGEDMGTYLRRRGTLPADEVVEMVEQIASALDAAHSKGIVHRDVKPQNIFRCRNAESKSYKLLDFGIARGAEPSHLTVLEVVGTPSYMAPEQALGARADHRCDVYALAAVAYRALTGRPPISFTDTRDTLARISSALPERPSQLAAVDEQVEAVLALGLARDREARFASAGAFANAFRAALEGKGAVQVHQRAVELVAWSESLQDPHRTQ